jgi:hypothetical protein
MRTRDVPAPMRRWCAYLLGEREGSGMLAYGWAIDARGASPHPPVHGPTEYLVEPERGGPAIWRHHSHVDFHPLRQPPAEVR